MALRKLNEARLDDATKLSLVRTWLAHERSLEAWIRTSASLITFGFSIDKFFEQFASAEALPAREHLRGSRGVALVMIGIGTAAIIAAAFQHRSALKTLEEEYGFRRPSLAVKVAAVVAVGGFVLLAIILLGR